MIALSASSRAAFCGAALVAFAAAFAVAPVVARGAAAVPATPVPISPSPVPASLAVVLPRRDPFAGALPPFRRSASPSSDASSVTPPRAVPLAPAPQFPAAAMPLTAPSGMLTAPSRPLDQPARAFDPRVTAVVTGAHSSALLDEGGSTRLVTVGDRIGDDRIVAIDLDGVLLARGTLLRLTSLQPTIPGGR
jgi:hypothetical protein